MPCAKLYDVDAQSKIVPQLATALPTITDGGKTVTIPVRDGVKFSDGTTFDRAAGWKDVPLDVDALADADHREV